MDTTEGRTSKRRWDVEVKRKPTLTDVALKAGVSPTTASYILNGRSVEMRISTEAQQRVRQAATDLAYRPNRSARTLRTAKTSTIGLISDHVASGQFASQMLTGASAAARETNHLLVIGETEGDVDLEAQLIEEMIDRQVDGLVYATLVARSITAPDKLTGQNVVLLNCFDPLSRLPAVLPDEVAGGRAAAQAVLAAGADRVAVVGFDPDATAVAGPRRLQGIRDELATAGLPPPETIECDWDVHAAHAAVRDWLRGGGNAAGLVCLNDRIAMGAYQALAECGLRVPDEVLVVSFDGSDLATWLSPPVTSIALPLTALGATAVRLLTGAVAASTHPVLVPMPIRVGGSLSRD